MINNHPFPAQNTIPVFLTLFLRSSLIGGSIELLLYYNIVVMKELKDDDVSTRGDEGSKDSPPASPFSYFERRIKPIQLRHKINCKLLFEKKIRLMKQTFFAYDKFTNTFYVPLITLNDCTQPRR